MKMKYLVPAFLAVSLVSGAVFSSDAFARSHNSDADGHKSGYTHSYNINGNHDNINENHHGGGSGHKGGGSGSNGGGSGHWGNR